MTGLEREVARRRRAALLVPPAAVAEPPVRCSAGLVAANCCVGEPWAAVTEMSLRMHGEPLPPAVIRVAAESGIEPHALDWHVEAEHGWEPHYDGYNDAVKRAAECVKGGSCG